MNLHIKHFQVEVQEKYFWASFSNSNSNSNFTSFLPHFLINLKKYIFHILINLGRRQDQDKVRHVLSIEVLSFVLKEIQM